METMLNAYDGPSSSPQEELEAESSKALDAKKKKPLPQARAPAKATGKRTRASQRKQGEQPQDPIITVDFD